VYSPSATTEVRCNRAAQESAFYLTALYEAFYEGDGGPELAYRFERFEEQA